MLNLIISILLSLGFNADSGSSFVMNDSNARIIQESPEFETNGGTTEFKNYVEIDANLSRDEIIIFDDDNPIK